MIPQSEQEQCSVPDSAPAQRPLLIKQSRSPLEKGERNRIRGVIDSVYGCDTQDLGAERSVYRWITRLVSSITALGVS